MNVSIYLSNQEVKKQLNGNSSNRYARNSSTVATSNTNSDKLTLPKKF